MKIYMVSIAFAPARVIIESYKQVYNTIGNINFEHKVLNNHYPIDKTRNNKLIETLVKSYGAEYVDLGGNTGLSGGYTYLVNSLNLQDDDIVFGIDPDVFPLTSGWGEAMVKVLTEPNTNIGWVSLYNHHSPREFKERGFSEHIIGGIKCHKVKTAMLNSICAWKGKMLKEMGGIKEPNKYYGGFESMSYPIITSLGYSWVYLPDYKEDYHILVEADKCYTEYKWAYARNHTTKLSFEEWLKENYPNYVKS